MHLLTQIFYGKWAISPDYARAAHPAISQLLKGEQAEWGYPSAGQGIIAPQSSTRQQTPLDEVEPGSILVIDLKGPMMREDRFCGPEGTERIAQRIRTADGMQNIAAIILEVNSPGGTVDGTEELANTIASSSTPIYALAHSAASAAYWASSHAQELWLSGKTAMAGSVGVVCSFTDVREAWEARGIKVHEVYARTSPDKNRSFREALEGNYDGLQDDLDQFDDIFMNSVREQRPNIAEEALSGGMYIAEDAVKLGMADRIGSMGELVAYIRKKHTSSSKPLFSMAEESSNKKSFMEKLNSVFKSEGDLQALNEEIQGQRATNAQLTEQASTITAERDQWKQKAEDLQASNTQLTEQVNTLTAERDQWKQKAEEYGSKDGDTTSKPAEKKAEGGEKASVPSYVNQDASHYSLLKGLK